MPVPQKTLWPLEPHTKAKHEILRRYLGAWFPILNRFNGRIIYVDGFCGPGRYAGGEDGSPVIALQVAVTHRRTLQGEVLFWFIDERADRIAHLKGEVAQLALPRHFNVQIETGRFADVFGAALNGLEVDDAPIAPTFAFIDPFGFSGIPFSLVERLLQQPRCEVLVTFMADAINRFLEHPSNQVVNHIVEAFGTSDAVSIATGAGDRVAALRELYQRQLMTAATFVRFFEMRDRNGRTQYLLFFASNHRLGHVKMKEAMWKVDETGEFRFSDATDPRQLILFEGDWSSQLADTIAAEFRGKRPVTGEQVRGFVEDNTPFLKKHMTAALRASEEAGRLVVEETKAGGEKRRSGTFPDDCQMRFTQGARGVRE